MKKKALLLCVCLVLMAVMLAGCYPGDGTYTSDKPAGFFWGVWHGWIAPISLVMGLFGKAKVYEQVNTGWWYDFGFYMAIISGFGGLSLFRKKKTCNRGDKG